MKRIYLVKPLHYKHGASLNPHVPYPAFYDDDNSVWRVHINNSAMVYAVLPKFVEKVVDNEPSLV